MASPLGMQYELLRIAAIRQTSMGGLGTLTDHMALQSESDRLASSVESKLFIDMNVPNANSPKTNTSPSCKSS